MEDFLVCKLFLTRSELSADDPSLAYEKMQWLKKHLQYGRPDLNEELKKIGLGFYKYVLFLLINPKFSKNCHCVKSVQIRSYFCPNTGKYRPERNSAFGQFFTQCMREPVVEVYLGPCETFDGAFWHS